MYWTEEDNNIVKNYYNKFGKNAVKELKKIFPNKSEINLRQKITNMIRNGLLNQHKNDVYKNKKKILGKEKEFILNNVGKITYKQMSETTNISLSSIQKFVANYKKEHREEFLNTKYDEFKEKMRLMKYQSNDMKYIATYEIEFICNDLGISEKEFDDFRYKFGNGSYKRRKGDKL